MSKRFERAACTRAGSATVRTRRRCSRSKSWASSRSARRISPGTGAGS
jgi:hypothetical protein